MSSSIGNNSRPLLEYLLLTILFDINNIDIKELDIKGLLENKGDSKR